MATSGSSTLSATSRFSLLSRARYLAHSALAKFREDCIEPESLADHVFASLVTARLRSVLIGPPSFGEVSPGE